MKPVSERTLALVLGTLTAFGPLSIDMYLPSLPAIERDLATTPSRVQLTLAAFFAGLALSQIVYGPLSDRFGRRRPLFVGLALYVATSALCAIAPNIELLIVCRFLQAVGGASGIVIARAVVRDLRSGAEAARLFSLLMLVMGIAPILAPLVGSALLAFGTWRLTFALLAVIALACLVIIPRVLPETAPPQDALDFASLRANFSALARDRAFVAYATAGGSAMSGMLAYIAGSPFVLIGIFHVSPRIYSVLFGMNAFGLIVASQLNRRLLVTCRPVAVLRVAIAVSLLAGLSFVALAMLHVDILPAVAACLFFFVASLGFVLPNSTALALEAHRARAGLASAVLGSLQFLIAAFAAGAVGLASDGTSRPMAVVMASCALLATIAAALGSR